MTCSCGEIIEPGINFCTRCGKQHGHEDPESVLNYGQCRKCGSFPVLPGARNHGELLPANDVGMRLRRLKYGSGMQVTFKRRNPY